MMRREAPEGDLAGRVAVVTGGGGGIGAAITARLSAAGATVAVADLDGERAQQVAAGVRAAGGEASGWTVDVRDEEAVRATWNAVVEAHGGLDVVVNNAGVASRSTIENLDRRDWQRVLGVNLDGALHGIRAAVAPMRGRGGGAIVNVASIAGRWIAYYAGIPYGTSKAALLALTRMSAFELGRHNIRVNAVLPGPMTNNMGGRPPATDDRAPNLPLGRLVHPADVAEAVAFLAGPAARMITGAELPVDGGFLTAPGAAYQGYFEVKGETFERTATPEAPE